MVNTAVRHHGQSHKIQGQLHFPSVFVLHQEQKHRECFQSPYHGLGVSHAVLIRSYNDPVRWAPLLVSVTALVRW